MLVKVVDIKGKEYWLNPVYVKAITMDARKGVTMIYCSAFGSFGAGAIKVRAHADEVASVLSDAMPGGMSLAAMAVEEEEQRRRQQAAVAAAG